jgi:hypothetical protein
MNRLQSSSSSSAFKSPSPRPTTGNDLKAPTSALTLRPSLDERRNYKDATPEEQTPVPFPRPVLGEKSNAVGDNNGIVADYKVPLKRTSPSPPGFGGKENGLYSRPPPSQPLPAIPAGDGHEQQPTQARPSAPKTTYVSVG